MELGECILQNLRKYSLDTVAGCTPVLPIYLTSFNQTSVNYWLACQTDLPVSLCYERKDQVDLPAYAGLVASVSIGDKLAWDYCNGGCGAELEKARKLGLLIHVWTFKDDALSFGASSASRMYQIATKELRLDGIITEFPEALRMAQNFI